MERIKHFGHYPGEDSKIHLKYKKENNQIIDKSELQKLEKLTLNIKHIEPLGKNPNFIEIHKTSNQSLNTKAENETNKQKADYYVVSVYDILINSGTKTWFGKRRWNGTLTTRAHIYFYNKKPN